MDQQSAVNKTKFIVLLMVVVAVFVSCAILAQYSSAWLQNNTSLTTSSNEIYAVNQGFANNIADFATNSDEEFNAVVSSIFNSSSSAHYQTVLPGDEVFYSFYARIRFSDVEAGITRYHVNLTISGEAREDAPAGTGDYLGFLHNCRIEENRSRFIVLEKKGDAFDHIIYYSDGSSGGTLKPKDGDFDADADTTYSYFDYNEGIIPSFTNTEVLSFCPDGTDESIGASLEITIPNLAGIVPVSEEEGDSFVYLMVFVPIWYIDIEENQNSEMNSVLKINGCTIVAVTGE